MRGGEESADSVDFDRMASPFPQHDATRRLTLADCASRPNRDMVKVAIGYLCIAALFLLLGGFRTEGV
jgi:hypothetical protein